MSVEIPKDVLMNRFKYRAEEDPDRDGFIFVSTTVARIPLSRHQLWDLCGRYASRLRRYGIKKGDVICSMIKTSRTKLISIFGVIAAGAVVVNGVTIQADGQDIFRILNISNCKTIIASCKNPEFIFLQKFLKIGKAQRTVGAESVHPVQCEKVPSLKRLIMYELNSHEDHTAFLSSLAGEDFYVAPVMADDEAYIFLTSGSTGYSKMVPRTHSECLAIVDTIKQDVQIVLNNRIMEWIGGFPSLYLGSGATTIVQEYLDKSVTMDVADIWNIACNEGADAAAISPVEIMAVKEAFDNGTITRRIKRIISGAQPIKRCVFDLLDVIFDEVMAMYGSTDMGFTVIGLITADMKDTVKDCYTGDRLVSNTQMKIVDEKTNMEITSKNRAGKLFFKGGTVLRHYMGVDSSNTGVFTEDGWFDSSDIGYLDESGGLVVIGRSSDFITCGSAVIHPQWLEEWITKCPGVASVMVVGIPHPVKVKELCVCVVREKSSSLTEQDLKAFCNQIYFDTHISPEEVPEKFFFTDSFPLTSTGKTWRKIMEKQATEHFQR